MVLLKNDGALPLKTTGAKILVVGPLAEQTRVLLGNYNGIPTHTVSILEGLKQEFAGDSINYMQGTGFLSKQAQPVPDALLTSDGQPGVKATYLNQNIVSFYVEQATNTAALATRIEPGIDHCGPAAAGEAANVDPLAVRWETTLAPTETGDYNLGVETDGFFRVFLDGRPVTMANYPHGVETVNRESTSGSGQAVQAGG